MIHLTSNKVAITPILDPDKTPGGLYIPDIAKERADQGIVKYIGPRVKDIKIGDYVLFGGYDGTTVRLEGEGTFILIREPFIKCILDRPDTDINGLYFRSKIDKDEQEEIRREILDAIRVAIETNNVSDDIIDSILEIYAKHDPYFTATHEMAINLVAEAWKDHPVRITTRANDPKKGDKIHDRAMVDHIIEEEDE